MRSRLIPRYHWPGSGGGQGTDGVAAQLPAELAEPAMIITLEREVEEEFREAMRARLVEKIMLVDQAMQGRPPKCEVHAARHDIARTEEEAFHQSVRLADNWVSRIAKELREGQVQKVVAKLRRIEVSRPEEKEKLEVLIRYYVSNAQRMRYDEYIRLGCGIGSGAVESAHKQVTHARLLQAGMRWSESGAQRLLALRVLLLNDNWSFLDRLVMQAIPT